MNNDDPEPGWYIIGGSFKTLHSAENHMQRLLDEGFFNARILHDEKGNNYRVAYDKYEYKETAEAEIKNLKTNSKQGNSFWVLKQ
jgi:cell division protein FtsN